MSPRYYLLENDAATGPHSLVVLRQKAEIHVITPATLAAPEATDSDPAPTWQPLRDLPELHALLFPPKPGLALQTASPFASLTPAESAHAPVEVQSLLRDNTLRQLAAENFDPATLPPGPDARRRRVFILFAVAFNAPAVLAYLLLPAENPVHLLAPSLALVATAVAYWLLYHVLDPR